MENNNINDDRGFFERILSEREKFEAERDRRIEEKFEALDKALKLQAEEYARRLSDLNGEYHRDRERQHDYVTTEKYESTLDSEKIAREAALLRVNEKMDGGFNRLNEQLTEYIKRYDLEKREIDLRLAAQIGAQEEAKRAAEEQGRKSDQLAKDQARKQGRNLAIVGFLLTGIIFAANFVSGFFG